MAPAKVRLSERLIAKGALSSTLPTNEPAAPPVAELQDSRRDCRSAGISVIAGYHRRSGPDLTHRPAAGDRAIELIGVGAAERQCGVVRHIADDGACCPAIA